MSENSQKNFGDSNLKTPEISYSRRVLIALGFAIGAGLLIVFVWQALYVLLLLFAGALVGILLHSFQCTITRYTRIPSSISLVLALAVVFGLLGTFIMLIAPVVKEQSVTLIDQIPESLRRLQFYLLNFSWGDELFGQTDEFENFFKRMNNKQIMDTLQNVLDIFSTTFGALMSILFIIIIGIYIAAELETYFEGVVRLIPISYRARGIEILHRLGYMLRWWMLGQSLSMLLLGFLVFWGLWIMDIPYAIVLALFTAIMTFIPNLGPILAYIPTALVTLTNDPVMLIYVTLFYVIIQTIEGFFITPMVHRKVITVPPVMILPVQILLLQLIGMLGVILAMPLVACAIVLIKMIYVEDILGDTDSRFKSETKRLIGM